MRILSHSSTQSIQAIDRAGLTVRLLNELDRMPNVKIFFNHKLTGADFKSNLAWFEQRGNFVPGGPTRRPPEIEVKFDFMIGADGAHSAVRFHLMKFARMTYQQEYIDTLWCEFAIPPVPEADGGGFRLSPNHLHIWPCGTFMFIAIPRLDRSFTCTLFLPESLYTQLDANPNSLVSFFQTNFPGVVPDLIAEDELKKQYSKNPHLPLISVKCSPYHFGSSVVILGDAAHAMVPFYGQGMNAGLEDVRVLFEFLDKHASTATSTQSTIHESSRASPSARRAAALEAYSAFRRPDAVAIGDLALRNYREMSSDVRSPMYRLRKLLEESLDSRIPRLGWATQYSRVSFGNERYSVVERQAMRQGAVLRWFVGVVGASAALGLTWALWSVTSAGRVKGAAKGAAEWLLGLLGSVRDFGRRV
jgi:kynurenine 3-monooxygenase